MHSYAPLTTPRILALSLHRLLKLAAWVRAVPFAEAAWLPKGDTTGKERRAFPDQGVWHVVAIPLMAVDVKYMATWKDLRWGWT